MSFMSGIFSLDPDMENATLGRILKSGLFPFNSDTKMCHVFVSIPYKYILYIRYSVLLLKYK